MKSKLHSAKTQGSMEFLLIIGGVILIAVIIALALKSSVIGAGQQQAIQAGQNVGLGFEQIGNQTSAVLCTDASLQNQTACQARADCTWNGSQCQALP